MANSNNIGEKNFFVFHWEIKDFLFSILKNEEFINSPNFFLPHFPRSIWHVRLYPAENVDGEECTTFVLITENTEHGPERVNVSCLFIVEGKFFPMGTVPVNKNDGQICKLSMLREICIFNNCFTMAFQIKYPTSITPGRLLNFENIFPADLKSDVQNFQKSMEELKSQAEAQVDKITKQLLPWPTQLWAKSLFGNDAKTTKWPIDYEAIMNDCYYNQVIAIMSFGNSPSLTISLNKKINDFMTVNIALGNRTATNSLYMVLEICLLVEEAELDTCFKHECLIQNGEVVVVEEAFNVRDLKVKLKDALPYVLSWQFKIEISNGYVRTEIARVHYENTCVDTPPKFGGGLMSDQVLQCYNGEKFRDVVIRVKDKSFRANKFVLSMISPVFCAMFSNETEENKTNIVEIVDLEAHIVSEMIHFMYTEQVIISDLSNALELYVAADKYQIKTLKNICRTFIINHMTSENALSIFSLSNLHSDSILETEAADRIWAFKKIILKSDEWLTLERENYPMAILILKRCLLQPPSSY